MTLRINCTHTHSIALVSVAMVVTCLAPLTASAMGECEDLPTTYELVGIDLARDHVLVKRTSAWCVAEDDDDGTLDEASGEVEVYESYDHSGELVAWHSDAPPQALDAVSERPPGDKLLSADPDEWKRNFRDVSDFRTSPSGRCAVEFETHDLPAAPGEFSTATVDVIVTVDENEAFRVEVGTTDDGEEPRIEALYLPEKNAVHLWVALTECSGPPPGYFGDEDGGMCYVEQVIEERVVSLSDQPALSGCFDVSVVADENTYAVIAKSFKQGHHKTSARALELQEALIRAGFESATIHDSREFATFTPGFTAVLVGRRASRDQAKALAKEAKAADFDGVYVKKIVD